MAFEFLRDTQLEVISNDNIGFLFELQIEILWDIFRVGNKSVDQKGQEGDCSAALDGAFFNIALDYFLGALIDLIKLFQGRRISLMQNYGGF